MFAIKLDENKYIKSYSAKFKTAESIVVSSIPDEADPDKLKCYKYINDEFVFDAEKWAAVEADRAASARLAEISACKAKLNLTDYNVIKLLESMASTLCGLLKIDLPDGFEAISEERQKLRDKINEIEASLNDK